MFLVNIEACLHRVRAANGGILPLYLDTWESVTAFAGECRIALPELEEVARGLTVPMQAYPTVEWVCEQYTKFLLYVAESELKDALKDPEPVVEVVPLKFAALMEQSTSNLAETGATCSEPAPAIFSPTGTFPGSPNVLSMGKKQSPKVLYQSTPTLVPRHLCERLKEK